jgi:putative flippase GtrA
VPVDWVDDPDSRVDIVATAREDLRGVWRLARELRRGHVDLPQPIPAQPPAFAAQVLRFVVIGVASTLAYVVLYLLLRSGMGGQAANALALLLTAIGNTAANRRYTFAVRGRERALRHQAQGLAVFGLALAVTAGSLALLHALVPSASHGVEVAVLVVANLAATVLRFVLLRGWVFRERRSAPALEESA